MRSSTAGPALTIIITLRGLARLATRSWSEWQPTNFLPFARPAMKSSTLLVVRLIHGDVVAAAFDVESQVFAHHGEADEADVSICVMLNVRSPLSKNVERNSSGS